MATTAIATQTVVLVTDGDFENATEIEVPLIREDDMQQHLEDDLIVNHIVDGKLVPCRWNELTPDERRAARAVMFSLYNY